MLGIYEGGALIVGDLKYIEGLQGPDWWYGPHSPNCTSDTGTHPFNCEAGCLFDLSTDWTEHINLKTTRAADFARMKSRFQELKESVGAGPDEVVRGVVDSEEGAEARAVQACDAMWQNGGFWSPFA